MFIIVYTPSNINRVLPNYLLITVLLHLFASKHEAKVFFLTTRLNPTAFRSILPSYWDLRKKRQIYVLIPFITSFQSLSQHKYIINFLHSTICKGFQSISNNYCATPTCYSGCILSSFNSGNEVLRNWEHWESETVADC